MDQIDDFRRSRLTSSWGTVGARKVDSLAISEETTSERGLLRYVEALSRLSEPIGKCQLSAERALKALVMASERG